jgi:hypothetical protein
MQGADGGTPQFDSTDTFRLGGEDLHLCGSSSSPGCQAGGTHFTEHENYQRIIQGATDWTIDSQNGTRSTYAPIFTINGFTYRWGLSLVRDILGNEVQYHWLCDPGKDCYPGDVTYNGYRVKFYYRDDRTDPISFATGASLGETRMLLLSIKVELESGTPIRAYKLKYNTSGSTGRWRLLSVQLYGKDVVIDPVTGAITGGTVLPAESYSYLADASDHSFTGGGTWGAGCNHSFGTGDFNRDGVQDVYCHEEWAGPLTVGISDGTSFTFSSWGSYCGGLNDWLSTGEFDGDGRTDFLCRNDSVGSTFVGISSDTGVSWSSWSPNWCPTPNATTFGDFNGDGRMDIGCHRTAANPPDVKVRLSTGTAFGADTNLDRQLVPGGRHELRRDLGGRSQGPPSRGLQRRWLHGPALSRGRGSGPDVGRSLGWRGWFCARRRVAAVVLRFQRPARPRRLQRRREDGPVLL